MQMSNNWGKEGLSSNKNKWKLRSGMTASSEKIIIDQDYDDPVHSYEQRS
jgi:hypothetical protein